MPESNRPEISLYSIVLDCSDAKALADFYAALLGWKKYTDNPEWISVGIKGRLLFCFSRKNPTTSLQSGQKRQISRFIWTFWCQILRLPWSTPCPWEQRLLQCSMLIIGL